MNAIERWLTGVTVVAVVATAVASPYTAPILSTLFGGVANVYRAARK
jgi:hypothetical protein